MSDACQRNTLPFGWSWETVTIWLLVFGLLYALQPVFLGSGQRPR